jgi:hypothetical protein
LLAAFASVGLFTQALSATVIGSLNVANCAGGGVSVTATTITFLPVGTAANTGCINTGIGTLLTYGTGGADTLNPAAVGNIMDLVLNVTPGTGFMTFASQPGQNGTTLSFTLVALGPGVTTNVGAAGCATATAGAVGTSCSVTGTSPFILTNAGGGQTGITLDASGTITDPTAAGGVSTWAGAFTTQLNLTPTQVYNDICSSPACTSGGTITSTDSAQFSLTTTPEPGTIGMMLSGGLLLAVSLLKRKGKV